MTKLILHVGAHKTGTTSIQRFLDQHHAWLLERGIYYPLSSRRIPQKRPHGHFARGLTGIDPAFESEVVQYAAEAEADARKAGANTVILSAESIYRRILGFEHIAASNVPDFWERRGGYLQRCAAALASFDIRVVLVLRRQDQFAESLYLGLAETGVDLGTFDSFLATMTHLFDYERQIALFRRVFGDGRVTVLSYHRLSSRGALIDNFFGALDLPIPPATDTVWIRRTLDPRLIVWLKDQKGENAWLLRRFLNSDPASALYPPPRATIWDTTAVRDAFIGRYRGINRRIEAEFPDKNAPFFAEPAAVTGPACVIGEPERKRLNALFLQFKAQQVRGGAPAPRL